MNIPSDIREAAEAAEAALSETFARIDGISRICTERVLDAFREYKVSEAMFTPSTGYGYGDFGRDTTDLVTAKILGAESAFCRSQLVSGTPYADCCPVRTSPSGRRAYLRNGHALRYAPSGYRY